jgi:hypothetical protein
MQRQHPAAAAANHAHIGRILNCGIGLPRDNLSHRRMARDLLNPPA